VQNIFEGKTLRCVYDKAAEKWWFSAVDICAIMLGENYDTARKYWKRLRSKFAARKIQLVTNSYQLKLPGADGKYYYTEVLDTREVAYLIQIIPSHKAEPYRLWLADVVAGSTGLEATLAKAGESDAARIDEHRKSSDEPYVLQVVTRESIV